MYIARIKFKFYKIYVLYVTNNYKHYDLLVCELTLIGLIKNKNNAKINVLN